MSRCKFDARRRAWVTGIALGIVGVLSGCGDGVDAVPVSGKITVDGEALHSKGGVVNFVPNKDKGNTTTLEPAGTIDEDGTYTVYYATGKKGAPPGWYRVQVTAMPPGDQPPSMPRPKRKDQPPPPRPLFNLKYASTKKSGLEIEVVRNPAPGAYDLKLSK